MGLNISLSPEVIFEVGSFPVTNAFFWSLFLSLFLIVVTLVIRFNLKTVPGKLQSVFELLLEGGYNFVMSIVDNEKKAKRVFPLVMTLFIFIVTANLATYIPGQAAIGLAKDEGVVPVFRSVMSDYGMVFVLTLITIIIIQIVAVITSGPLRYVTQFFDPRSPLKLFLSTMNIIGETAKVVSLSFRLFGNIFAGEVLGAVMLFLFPFFLPLPFMFLGLLTAIVQAFVFSVLTLVFISMASERQVEKAA